MMKTIDEFGNYKTVIKSKMITKEMADEFLKRDGLTVAVGNFYYSELELVTKPKNENRSFEEFYDLNEF